MDPKWDLQGGLRLIWAIEDDVDKLGYTVTLGGGVLRRGHTYSSIDLFMVPQEAVNYEDGSLVKCDAKGLIKYLAGLWGNNFQTLNLNLVKMGGGKKSKWEGIEKFQDEAPAGWTHTVVAGTPITGRVTGGAATRWSDSIQRTQPAAPEPERGVEQFWRNQDPRVEEEVVPVEVLEVPEFPVKESSFLYKVTFTRGGGDQVRVFILKGGELKEEVKDSKSLEYVDFSDAQDQILENVIFRAADAGRG